MLLDNDRAHHNSSGDACCPEVSATKEAVERGDWPAAREAFQLAGGLQMFQVADHAFNRRIGIDRPRLKSAELFSAGVV